MSSLGIGYRRNSDRIEKENTSKESICSEPLSNQ